MTTPHLYHRWRSRYGVWHLFFSHRTDEDQIHVEAFGPQDGQCLSLWHYSRDYTEAELEMRRQIDGTNVPAVGVGGGGTSADAGT